MKDKKKVEDVKKKKVVQMDSKYLVDLTIRTRRVYLQGVIDEQVVKAVTEELLLLDSIKKAPITLFINSPGGLVTGTLSIIDTMEAIKSEVHTVVVGHACSGAALISVCGKTRGMSKRSIWMIHPMTAGVVDYHSFMKDKMEGLGLLDDTIDGIISKFTKLPVALRKKYKNGEVWLNAQQCKKYKVIDKIITKL